MHRRFLLRKKVFILSNDFLFWGFEAFSLRIFKFLQLNLCLINVSLPIYLNSILSDLRQLHYWLVYLLVLSCFLSHLVFESLLFNTQFLVLDIKRVGICNSFTVLGMLDTHRLMQVCDSIIMLRNTTLLLLLQLYTHRMSSIRLVNRTVPLKIQKLIFDCLLFFLKLILDERVDILVNGRRVSYQKVRYGEKFCYFFEVYWCAMVLG